MRPPTASYLTDFRIIRARHEIEQNQGLDWLAGVRTRAQGGGAEAHARLVKRAARFGAGADKIARRSSVSRDFSHQNWDEMELFHLRGGVPGTTDRMRIYGPAVRDSFTRFYAEETTAPSDLIHVTCTGYEAPSAAQRLVAARGWHEQTTVTHAYHMGCYASFPAIRMATSFLAAGRARVDVVHTELCSLHAQPDDNEPEQLVVESLFADGFARYSVTSRPGAGFRVLAVREEILPDSAGDMSWTCSDRGMRMTLSREVPRRLSTALKNFVETLCREAGAGSNESAFFAVHPGGPSVIDQVQQALEIPEARLRWSREVLRQNGNMSSATLPHIWAAMAVDPSIPAGAPVVSVAFGPGLTICGSVMLKTAGNE